MLIDKLSPFLHLCKQRECDKHASFVYNSANCHNTKLKKLQILEKKIEEKKKLFLNDKGQTNQMVIPKQRLISHGGQPTAKLQPQCYCIIQQSLVTSPASRGKLERNQSANDYKVSSNQWSAQGRCRSKSDERLKPARDAVDVMRELGHTAMGSKGFSKRVGWMSFGKENGG